MTSLPQPSDQQSQAHRDHDEIDLLGLLKSVLATWKIWLIALVLVSALYGAYQASKILLLSNEITYAKPIRLIFPDAHKLQFPNGAPFSFGDIIAPVIVQAAHQRNHLDEYNMSIADLQGSLSAEPYAPTYPIIVKKYHGLLADKKLSFDQAEELQRRMNAELDQAARGTVLISMRLENSQLPESVASKVLSDIPAIWAERAIKDKGVLDLNIQLASSRSLNAELIQKVEYMIISDLLDEKLGLLHENIEKLSEFDGISTIADPETGMKLADLTNAIDDLGRYVINELMSPVRYLGLSRDSQLSIYYYEDRMKKLKLNLSLLQHQAALAKNAFDNYKGTEQRLGASDASATTVSQLAGDSLEKLMQMSGESEREAYKQKLNQQWLDYNLQAAQIENRIADVALIVASLHEADNVPVNIGDGAGHQIYLENVKTELPGILAELSDYFDVTQRIYNQLNIEAIGVRDRLYSPITNRVLAQSEGLNLKSVILVWFALMFLTSIIVIPTVMVRNAMKVKV